LCSLSPSLSLPLSLSLALSLSLFSLPISLSLSVPLPLSLSLLSLSLSFSIPLFLYLSLPPALSRCLAVFVSEYRSNLLDASWLTIGIPPWHPARHTSPQNAISTPKHSTPTPHPSTPNCHTSYLTQIVCSPLSMLRNSRPAPHITLLCPHDQDLFSLCLFAPRLVLMFLWL